MTLAEKRVPPGFQRALNGWIVGIECGQVVQRVCQHIPVRKLCRGKELIARRRDWYIHEFQYSLLSR